MRGARIGWMAGALAATLLGACGSDSSTDGGNGGNGGTGGSGGGNAACVPACGAGFACVDAVCLPDTDGDGVPDGADACPATPAGATVDARGCAFAEAPVAWSDGPYGTAIRDLAGDFTVNTLDGPWNFRQSWTGQESYLFLLKSDDSEYARAYWNSDVKRLLKETPENTHLVLLSADTPQADMEAMKARIDTALGTIAYARAAAWNGRIHYVVDDVANLDGALGQFFTAYPAYHFAIDRFQRWREVGMLWDPNNGSYPIRSLGREANYFNYERRNERAMAGVDATVVTLADGTRHAGGWETGYATRLEADFPSAEEMAGFDSMAVYFYTACPNHLQGKDAGCNEWDFAQSLLLCDPADEASCVELVRYVTPYGREGEWLTDVSPLLALVKDGGHRAFRYEGANGYDLHAKILLWNAGKPYRPVEARFLWGHGPSAQTWDATYNPSQLPVTFTVDDPAATHVELFASISGHGWGSTAENCAEFCNHQHEFSLNGTAFLREHPTAGTSYGCYDRVDEGVVPNQFGTWPLGRAGWCPGLDVKPWVQDISDAVVSGENTLSYRALFEGEEYVPVPLPDVQDPYMPELRVASWLVFYAPAN
jgi:hypothetical protein